MEKHFPFLLDKKKISSMLSFKKNKFIFILFFLIEIVVAQNSPSVNITINDADEFITAFKELEKEIQ